MCVCACVFPEEEQGGVNLGGLIFIFILKSALVPSAAQGASAALSLFCILYDVVQPTLGCSLPRTFVLIKEDTGLKP